MYSPLSKDEINTLPLASYEGEVRVIRCEHELDAFLPRLAQEKLWGFDTETKPTFTKGASSSPALIQIALADFVSIIQLNCVGLPPALAALLADASIIKAGVAIRDDMRSLTTLLPFNPEGAVDLAALARSKGIKAQGLRSLAAQLLGFRISKSAQCSNWDKDFLSPQQIRYAATDAWVSREIYRKLVG